MKFRLSIFIIAVINLFAACGNDDAIPNINENAWSRADIVTGVRMTNLNGLPISQVGNPNVKNTDFEVFPNPAQDVVSIITRNRIKEILISPATKLDSFRTENFEERFENFQYPIEEIVVPTTFRIGFDSLVQTLQLNISDFPTGYYRLFLNDTQGGEFQWENIYIDNENTYPASIDSLVSDWN